MADVKALRDSLETLARQWGADLFGVADLTSAGDFVARQAKTVGWPAAERAVVSFPRGISVGARIPDALVDNIDPELPRLGNPYGHYVYQIATPHLDVMAFQLVGLLQRNGYQAFPIASSQPVGRTSLFSHKLAAHLAGLGWIGKSCLLISPSFGPRVRFATILTDAPLAAGTPLRKRCGKCVACVAACPVDAFTGVEFKPSDPREVRFDAAKCSAYRDGDPNDTPQRSRICGMCVSACPIGSRRTK